MIQTHLRDLIPFDIYTLNEKISCVQNHHCSSEQPLTKLPRLVFTGTMTALINNFTATMNTLCTSLRATMNVMSILLTVTMKEVYELCPLNNTMAHTLAPLNLTLILYSRNQCFSSLTRKKQGRPKASTSDTLETRQNRQGDRTRPQTHYRQGKEGQNTHRQTKT